MKKYTGRIEMLLEGVSIAGEGNFLMVEEAVAKFRAAGLGHLLPQMDDRVHRNFP